MHRSQLAGFIIDCKGEDLDAAARFWSRALGFPIATSDDPSENAYVKLEAGPDLHVEVQRVDHDSRVHLDIEADDVEAEVARLEKLGAKKVVQIRTWWVMQAPTGQRFCVVRAQNRSFATNANIWD